MKRVAAFLLFILFIPLVAAQGFAISYPPGLKELKVSSDGYEFNVTLINSLDSELTVDIQAAGENVIITVPGRVVVPPKNAVKVTISLRAPENVTAPKFEGYIRFVVHMPGSGGQVAGSVTVPVAGVWSGWSPTTTENATAGIQEPENTTNITTLNRNQTLVMVGRGSTSQNSPENNTLSDPIEELILKYSSENSETSNAESSGEIQINENSSMAASVNQPTSTLPAINYPTQPKESGLNPAVYLIVGVAVGLILRRYTNRGGEHEEGDYSAPHGDYA